jgi:hypothetical protein
MMQQKFDSGTYLGDNIFSKYSLSESPVLVAEAGFREQNCVHGDREI